MIISFKKKYQCVTGLPIIHSADTEIFKINYFAHCMKCDFCRDQCCSYGADIDMLNVERILNYKQEIEADTSISPSKWFYPKKRKWDKEYPGNFYTRISKHNNACIFLNRTGRGCLLHSYALKEGLDYHIFKPFFCTIFPVTYFDGVLVVPEEIEEGLTECLGDGINLYRGAREELRYFFGGEMVDELDEIEQSVLGEKKSA